MMRSASLLGVAAVFVALATVQPVRAGGIRSNRARGPAMDKLQAYITDVETAVRREMADAETRGNERCTGNASANVAMQTFRHDTENLANVSFQYIVGCEASSSCETRTTAMLSSIRNSFACFDEKMGDYKSAEQELGSKQQDAAQKGAQIDSLKTAHNGTTTAARNRIQEHKEAIDFLNTLSTHMQSGFSTSSLLETGRRVLGRVADSFPAVKSIISFLQQPSAKDEAVARLLSFIQEIIFGLEESNTYEKHQLEFDTRDYASDKQKYETELATLQKAAVDAQARMDEARAAGMKCQNSATSDMNELASFTSRCAEGHNIFLQGHAAHVHELNAIQSLRQVISQGGAALGKASVKSTLANITAAQESSQETLEQGPEVEHRLSVQPPVIVEPEAQAAQIAPIVNPQGQEQETGIQQEQ